MNPGYRLVFVRGEAAAGVSVSRSRGAVLFIENGDSFSWNVVDALPFAREELQLVSGSERAQISRALSHARAVVIGPEPTDPVRAGLLGWVERIAQLRVPALGICLGHQAVGLAFGAVLRRTEPRHGEVDEVRFEGARWLRAGDGPERVMRYHSLALDEVRAPLRVVARASDGTVMAVEHEDLPIAGVQFHPDSYATPNGRAMLEHFFRSVA